MVFLHGGAFVMGGGSSYFFGPKLLMEQNIVLVTVQYRLGALGIAKDNSLPETKFRRIYSLLVLIDDCTCRFLEYWGSSSPG
jgi:carboxylesterase type B